MVNMFVDIYNTDKKYSIIYADPPWSYRVWNKGSCRTASAHYDTMSKKDMQEMSRVIKKISDTDCTLFLWLTMPNNLKPCPLNVVEVIRCGQCKFWNREHISCEGYAKCNTGESGIRLRRKNDYCSVAQPLTDDDMRKEDEGK